MREYFIFDVEELKKIENQRGSNLNQMEACIISAIKNYGEKGFFGSQATLARKLFCTDRAVRNNLKKLVADNILLKKKTKNGDIYKYNKKFLDFPQEEEKTEFDLEWEAFQAEERKKAQNINNIII